MKFKKGVILHANNEALRVMDVVDNVHETLTGRQALMTSAQDGTHSEESLHYYNQAWDIRRWYTDDQNETEHFVSVVREELGPDYDVVLEKTHVHIEYDPK